MFRPGSRYAGAGTYQVTLSDGSVVLVTRTPLPVVGPPIGWHRRLEDERLDLIAYRFLNDATRAWMLCDTNNAMAPDALAAHDLIGIPDARR